ncbi:AN1-type zinc finger protein 2A-like [Dysidea avara]|uniref:AN1-type zinc finger protein 2A-like n=1 Tax=Dysidea avara TaxID=196820 RepID=UPI003332F78B
MAANSEEIDLMGIGKHCSYCRRLDILPFTCTKCQEVFCKEHMNEVAHECPNQQMGNVVLPTCPLCQAVILLKDGRNVNDQVEKHIISGCQDLIATNRPKESSLFHRCTYRKCKQKELVPICCDKCHRNFCIRHRHYQDHHCSNVTQSTRRPIAVH